MIIFALSGVLYSITAVVEDSLFRLSQNLQDNWPLQLMERSITSSRFLFCGCRSTLGTPALFIIATILTNLLCATAIYIVARRLVQLVRSASTADA